MRLTIVRLIVIFVFGLVAAHLAVAAPALAKAPQFATMRPNALAEKWVLKQIAAGRVADLKERFPDEGKRVLSASLLDKLLTNTLKGITMHRHGVRIRNAVFVEALDLENAEIPHEIWLDSCRFEEEVNFTQTIFQKSISFEASSFKTATFNGMKVGAGVFIRKAAFAGPVDFRSAGITGNFEADEAQFTNAAQAATFNSMQVGAHASFSKAIFAGPVDFGGASVTGNFWVDKAQFTNAEQTTTFNSMRVGDVAFFRETIFAGSVSMMDVTVLDIFIQGPEKTASSLIFQRFDLSRAMIRRQLYMENVKLQELIATSLRVEGPTSLTRLTIDQRANLESSSFQTMALSQVSWPNVPDDVRIDTMTYQYVTAGSERDTSENLMALVNQARFSTSVYNYLEGFFRRQGYAEQADAVFIAQKKRAGTEVLRRYSVEWWKNHVLGILVNYGRNPERAFYWSALFIIIGMVVFWHECGMACQKTEGTVPKYSAWWYSLDLFMPVVDLKFADVWIPDPNRKIARNYARVHRFLGWILIPIGLAAVTGLIK